MTSALPFVLDAGEVLEPEPRVVLEDGVVFGVLDRAAAVPPPVLTVAWLEEPLGVTLEEVVAEELPRLLTEPEAVLIDQEPTSVDGREAVRTFTLHRGPDGLPAASEQWRLVSAGRRWTVSAMTALADQPAWGPRLAEVVAGLRIVPR
jgi:hypothetical protein